MVPGMGPGTINLLNNGKCFFLLFFLLCTSEYFHNIFIAVCHEIKLLFEAYKKTHDFYAQSDYKFLLAHYYHLRKLVTSVDRQLNCLLFLGSSSKLCSPLFRFDLNLRICKKSYPWAGYFNDYSRLLQYYDVLSYVFYGQIECQCLHQP
ncbi:hypothetical protein CEXT_259351 [Caerostris extrusa]|uniref:Uncharacterized protein n=1 Tax=Caerostris extrusa TaxID=172846 RepID=A0AAV4TN75_CAEEX|nr:hypothetical protein CEXT_259351 [Caerostris extrusa]